MPPPDIDEGTAIINYYLQRIATGGDTNQKIQVSVPDSSVVAQIVTEAIKRCRRRNQFYCGADYEAAVNEAYHSTARELGTEATEVVVSEARVRKCLEETPCSIGEKAIRNFLEDARRYCTESVSKEIAARFDCPQAPDI